MADINWDERFARITERHEALAQTVELLTQSSIRQSESIDKLIEESREHTRQLLVDSENIRGLARIAEIHEQRLSGLEGAQ